MEGERFGPGEFVASPALFFFVYLIRKPLANPFFSKSPDFLGKASLIQKKRVFTALKDLFSRRFPSFFFLSCSQCGTCVFLLSACFSLLRRGGEPQRLALAFRPCGLFPLGRSCFFLRSLGSLTGACSPSPRRPAGSAQKTTAPFHGRNPLLVAFSSGCRRKYMDTESRTASPSSIMS